MKKKLRLWILALPFLLYYLGAGMNILCVTANHGGMPVYMPVTFPNACAKNMDDFDFMGVKLHVVMPEACQEGQVLDPKHIVAGPGTNLKFLTDWIQIAGAGVISPGDCLLWLGDLIEYPFIAAWLFPLVLA